MISRHAFQLAYAKLYCRWQLARMKAGRYGTAHLLPGACGFFGNMFMTLNGIRLSEAAGVQPKPTWGADSLFYEPGRGDNVWSYYFEDVPPLVEKSEQKLQQRRKTISFKPTADEIYPRYRGLDVRQSYAECIRRYVKLRPEHNDEFDRLSAEMFQGRHVLGVHVRLTDTVSGVENRQSYDVDSYCHAIDAYLARETGARLFVASDSNAAVASLRLRYGSRVTALDCIRSDNNVSVHGHYDGGVLGSPYRKGYEVVRDAYLLSRVHHLIRVESRVTAFSLCLNPTLDTTDLRGDAARHI